MSITICVVAPTWERPLIGTLFVQQLVRWKEFVDAMGYDIDLHAIIVGSEGDSSRSMVIASSMKEDYISYLEFPNKPLGRKFNAGVHAAQTVNPDYVMIMGDDAFCLPTIFSEYLVAIEAGHKYIGVRDLYSWDFINGAALYWPGYNGKREGEAIGSGRLVHKDILNGLDKPWMLYDDVKNRNLDYSMTQQIGLPHLIDGSMHLMTTIKGHNNITDMYAAPDTEEVTTDRFYVLFNRF